MIHKSRKPLENTVEIKCKCPVCKSENTKENAKYQNNGIIGPGFSSWKVSSHFVCEDCGVMFQPVKGNGL